MARTRAVVVAILAAASLGGWLLGRHDAAQPTSARMTGVVTRDIDGDTAIVDVGGRKETVRFLAIDTPETHDPRKPVQCYGPEAAAYTKSRLTGKTVQLETDVETRDKYGRLLAYVILDGQRFNDELLRLGYARLLVIAPNGVYARSELTLELAARQARRGLWGTCPNP
jgi:micrococcal nuclease